MLKDISESLEEAQTLVFRFLGNYSNLENILQVAKRFSATIVKGGKIISCGNGGSMCDAMHFSEELTARFKTNRISLPAIAISDPGHITCTGNDYGFDQIFSRYVQGLGVKGDALLGISTSGNSPNIIKAVEAAKAKGMFSVCLLGKDGGKLKDLADLSIIIPHEKTERIQEMHIKVIHIVIDSIEKILRKENYMQ